MLEKVLDIQMMETVPMDVYVQFKKLQEGYTDHLL